MGATEADRFFDLLVKLAPPNGIPSESSIQNVLTMNPSAKSRSNKNQELADFTLLEEIQREMRGK
jgi:hypothetical protein